MSAQFLKPKGPVLVAAAIIQDQHARFLITQRRLEAAVEAGKWEFPGGKIEPGESPEVCLVREIKEELGIEVEVGEVLGIVSHVYDSGESGLHIILLGYRCRKVKGEVQLLEVADAKWVKAADFAGFAFAAADIPFIERLPR